MTSVSGFGQTGPYKEKPGFGTVAETGSGFAYINGWPETPPTSPPFGFADSIAGISAAMGTAMALFRRERTGQGDHVDVSLYEPLMFIVGDMIMNYTGTGFVQGRVGNGTGSASPRGVYQAADGKWLSIAASNQGIAKRLFAAMGQPEMIENPRYATNEVRMQHNEELQALVKGWVARAAAGRDPQGPRRVRGRLLAGQRRQRHRRRTRTSRSGRWSSSPASRRSGRVLMPGPVLKFEGGADPVYDGVPSIGEHTDEVLTDLLSLSGAEISRARRGRHGAVRRSGRHARAVTGLTAVDTPAVSTAVVLRAGRRRR